MKSLLAIGIVLLIFSSTDSIAIRVLSIIYLIIAFIVELYVLGDEKNNSA